MVTYTQFFESANCGLYHYAANNPVRYTDPDGRILNILTAGIGAVLGGAVVALGAYAAGASVKQIAIAAGIGAIAGAIAGATLGGSVAVQAVTQSAVINSLASGAVNVFIQTKNIVNGESNKTEIDKKETASAMVGSFTSTIITGGINSRIGDYIDSNLDKFFDSHIAGGIVGTEISQILDNVRKKTSLTNNIDRSFVYGCASGIVSFFQPIEKGRKIVQSIFQGAKSELQNAALTEWIKEKMHDKENNL